jgi:class 3 adenylate cyclase
MENRIVIRPADPDLRRELFGDSDETALMIDSDTDTSVALEGHRTFRQGEFADIILLAVQWGSPVGVGLITHWLYDRLKDKRVRISINGRSTDITKDQIHHALSPVDAIVSSGSAETRSPQFVTWAGGSRVVLAIVFTDIVGSTDLLEAVGDDEMHRVLRIHFSESRRLIAEKGGREVKTIGDGVMVAFRTVEAALDYASALRSAPGDPRLKVRAGIHVGPMSVDGEDVFGGTVNLAARITQQIKDAEIWVSDDAKRHLMLSRLPRHSNFQWIEHQGMTLGGFSGTYTLWSLANK